MTVLVLLFGISRDIVGSKSIQMDFEGEVCVKDLMDKMKENYPKFKELSSLLIAVNDKYASDDTVLSGSEEIALIPPVSGG